MGLDTLVLPLIHVIFPTAVMIHIASSGLMDSVKTELGLEHYAEQPHPQLNNIMPLNTLINFGYSMFGLAWLYSTYQAVNDGVLQTKDRYYFHVFGWIAVFYGPVQLARLLTHEQSWAVMDQWVTLPAFSWPVSWGLHICFRTGGITNLIITLLSMTSYLLALKTPIGFEIALGSHAAIAIIVCTLVYRRYPNPGALKAFFLTLLCFTGFVVLKLADLHLPDYSEVFSVVSGHFLSKICDIFQIHFVAEFFYCILRAKYHEEKRS